MIINQSDNLTVPEKVIAVFPLKPSSKLKEFDMNFDLFLKPLNTTHRREWFSQNFYNCLPLSIGNMQGFVFSLPFSLEVMWTGGNSIEDLIMVLDGEEVKQYENMNHVFVSSEFGHGILTVHFPIQIKTPPGVNLMTIAPPNFPLAGISPMTGVVESDNIRFTFTINLKIDVPNVSVKIKKDYPIAGIIPIPRYFCDSFELKDAREIFDKKNIDEEMDIVYRHSIKREISNNNQLGPDRLYYKGMDVDNNKFIDHQIPNKINPKT